MIGAHWQLEPLQLLPVVLFAGMYSARVRSLGARGRPVSTLRVAAFYLGLLLALLALVSPLDWYGENRRLWVHMIQHLVLGDIAPLLIVLGLTGPILRPVLAIGWIRRLRWLAHPLVALPLWIIDLAVWHVGFLYQLALRHTDVHALEHMCFFIFGALMWAAVIEPVPGPEWFGNGWKAVYTLLVRTGGAILANVFIWANAPFYSYYLIWEHGSGAALADQRAAGAIMFIEGGVVTLLAFAWLFLRFTRETEVRQRLIEDNVTHDRAARAARYGRSAQARRIMP
jgi:putative membrane protein